tara:strand:+ start:260 stop:484 length:225 start_codon:yes stop_codon:yes gene_type:complete
VHLDAQQHRSNGDADISDVKLDPMNIFPCDTNKVIMLMMLHMCISIKIKWFLPMKKSMAAVDHEIFNNKANNYL